MPKGKISAPSLSADEVASLLSYDPGTGIFVWKANVGTAKAGSIAGHSSKRGDRYIRINGRLYLGARLAWLLMTGAWPEGRIARRNRVAGDNRWDNLCLPSDLIQPLTAERLREIVNYDPETGEFTWKLRIGVKVKIGERAGWSHSGGYVGLNVGGHKMFAHQAAWLYMTGEWPKNQIDHENKNRSDNRWDNLRDATQTQNSANMGRRSSNKSGFKGVNASLNGKRWIAYIHHKKTRYLGTFDTPEEAHAAYQKAAIELWGEYASYE